MLGLRTVRGHYIGPLNNHLRALTSHGSVCGPQPIIQNTLLYMEGLTAKRLRLLNISASRTCSLYHVEDKTVDHLLVSCPVSKSIWNLFPQTKNIPKSSVTFSQWFWSNASKSSVKFAVFGCWLIWKTRSDRLYSHSPILPPSVGFKTTFSWYEWNQTYGSRHQLTMSNYTLMALSIHLLNVEELVESFEARQCDF